MTQTVIPLSKFVGVTVTTWFYIADLWVFTSSAQTGSKVAASR